MPDDARDLICLATHGTDHELSSVGLTIANGGITAGLNVSIFLSSSGADLRALMDGASLSGSPRFAACVGELKLDL